MSARSAWPLQEKSCLRQPEGGKKEKALDFNTPTSTAQAIERI